MNKTTQLAREKIRILRAKLGGITAAEAARRIGVPAQKMSRILHKDHITVDDLQMVADGLGCHLEISFLIREKGEWI